MKGSWDDYSQYMESHKIHVPNHQPEQLNSQDSQSGFPSPRPQTPVLGVLHEVKALFRPVGTAAAEKLLGLGYGSTRGAHEEESIHGYFPHLSTTLTLCVGRRRPILNRSLEKGPNRILGSK